MIPGYDKVDPTSGADRFIENYRVSEARWTFDDGSSILQDFADDRAVQSMPVDVITMNATIEILGTYEPRYSPEDAHRREFVPVSEVAFLGSSQ